MMEGLKICVITPELLNQWADSLDVFPNKNNVEFVASQMRLVSTDRLVNDTDKDLDRLCVLAAGLSGYLDVPATTEEWKVETAHVADLSSMLLIELKSRLAK